MSGFSWPARVYWEDTDGGAVVYYANYLRFFERARTEWLRCHGHSQHELVQNQGIVFAVMSIHVDYRAPARLDDELQITCEPRASGATSLHFAQQIYRADATTRGLLADADVRVVCVDAKTFRPKRLPQFVLNAVAGEAASNG